MTKLKISTLALLFFFITSSILAQIRPHIPKPHKRVHNKAHAKAKQAGEKERRRFLNKKLNDAFNGIDKNMHKDLPETYLFTWTYTLQIQTKKDATEIHYFLQPNETYLGFKLEAKKKKNSDLGFFIMDTKRNKSIILMDIENEKRLITTKLPKQKTADKQEKYTITKIGTKVILGYTCQGYKMVSKEGEAITYVLENAPVNFNQIYTIKAKNSPKGFNPSWLKQIKNGLVMEMDYTSYKKKKHTKMKCTALKKEKKTINIKEYNFFGN